MSTEISLYITCAVGLEKLLASELSTMGIGGVRIQGAGVQCEADLESAYRICLWSRVANRVLLPIDKGPANTPEELYALIQSIDWSEHLNATDTLAVDCFVAKSEITHSQYAALKVKDAVVDQFREKMSIRPSVDRETPSVRINVYLYKNVARVAIDLSGMSLHRRGYRQQQGRAPLKENLAASLLLSMQWPERASASAKLVDPLCGSGTLVIEAALMASMRAPGLSRDYFGFLGWLKHDDEIWQKVKADAKTRIVACSNVLIGADSDKRMIEVARQNAKAAGVSHLVQFVVCDVADPVLDSISNVKEPVAETLATDNAVPADDAIEAVEELSNNLMITNPPYGERLEAGSDFYQMLGQGLSQHYAGWTAAIIVSDLRMLRESRLPLTDRKEFRNGAIDCVLASGVVPKGSVADVDATPFTNRIVKNQRKLKSWLKQSKAQAYRLYDADLPDFAVAIDVYECKPRQVVVQEYQAPATVNVALAKARLAAVKSSLPELLHIEPAQLHIKLREKQSGLQQYEKEAERKVVGVLEEDGYQLGLNFSDYLDTGLFLDHRKVRRYVHQNSQDVRFLNLFSYTSSVTVAAIAGGAASTVSVDLSRNYCEWSMRNFNLNGFSSKEHQVERSDVMDWLQASKSSQPFDLILLDPPTFSNSNSTEKDWDVQSDHVKCIELCLEILNPGGLLIFSTNYRRFKLDKSILDASPDKLAIEDRTRWSIDKDFERNQRIHQCWFIRRT